MKKFAIVLAAAALVSVVACKKSPEAAAVENNADMMADNMDAMADNISATADNTANATAAGMMEAAKGFRRLKACKQLPALRAALAAHHANVVALEEKSQAA